MLTLSFALASCGQAGSLYIPDPAQTDAQTSNE
ncbi:lipoprotein [Candidatus Njordibacter sp. Uisw_002]